MSGFLFYGFGALCILGALAMIANVRHVTSAAFSFVGSMLALGAVYVLLDAVFVAAIQVLFHAGGLAVVFAAAGAILVPRSDRMRASRGRGGSVVAVVLAVIVLVNGALLLPGGFGERAELPDGFGGYRLVGSVLLTDRVLAFGFISLLLLSAVIAVVVLARREAD